MDRLIQDEVNELEAKLHLIMEHDRIWNLKVAYSSVLAKVEELEGKYSCNDVIDSDKLKEYLRDRLRELE